MPKRAIPLRRLLLREGVFMVAVAGIGLTLSAWWGTRSIMQDQAQARAEAGLQHASQRLAQTFEEALRTGDLMAHLWKEGHAPTPLGTLDTEKQTLAFLQSRRALCNITLVDVQGRASAANAPEATNPGVWITRGTRAMRRWSARGDLLAESLDPAVPPDWRQRPWYRQAMAEGMPTWTAPYPFLGTVGYGITYTYPVFSPSGQSLGVVGIDLLLGDLGPWLQEGLPTDGTQLILLDEQGRVLVPPKQFVGESSGLRRSVLPEPMVSASIPLVKDVMKALLPHRGERWIRVRSGGRTYFACERSVAIPSGPAWRMVMAIPEDDLLLHPRRVAAISLVLSLLAVLLLAWRLRRLSTTVETPLAALAAQGAKLLDGQPIHAPDTRILEIQELVQCLRVASLSFGQRELLESQLRQAQRLELVGTLAAGVAHDLGNLLNAVGANVELAQDPHLSLEKRDQALHRSSQAMRRARGFIRALLTLGRPAEQTLASLDLNQPVNNAIRLLDPLLGSSIALQVELASEDLRVMADPLEIEQVVLNLGVNARDAMPKGGTLIVRTGRGTDGRPYLDMRDTGVGIPKAIRDTLFTAFVTTKGPDKGSGLGLAMVQGIAKAHAAELVVESEEGQGTRFALFFPAV